MQKTNKLRVCPKCGAAIFNNKHCGCRRAIYGKAAKADARNAAAYSQSYARKTTI